MSFYCPLLDAGCRNAYGSVFCCNCDYYVEFKKEC